MHCSRHKCRDIVKWIVLACLIVVFANASPVEPEDYPLDTDPFDPNFLMHLRERMTLRKRPTIEWEDVNYQSQPPSAPIKGKNRQIDNSEEISADTEREPDQKDSSTENKIPMSASEQSTTNELLIKVHRELQEINDNLCKLTTTVDREISVMRLTLARVAAEVQIVKENQELLPGLQILAQETEIKSETTERQPNGFKICPNQFTKIYGRCYYFSGINTQLWDEALSTCQSLDPRATLLNLETEEEWSNINDYINGRNSMLDKDWWIGASDIAHEGKFTWTMNNTTLTIPAWCLKQPDNYENNENCVHIARKSHTRENLCFNDLKCDGNRWDAYPNFICEIYD